MARSNLAHISLSHPVVAPLALFAVIVALRVVDVFVLRLDQLTDEVILSKLLGIPVIVAYLWAVGGSLRGIGIRREEFWTAALVGGGGTLAFFAAGYAAQLAIFSEQGRQPELVFTAINPQTHAESLPFAFWLIPAIALGALKEEMLFRGVILRGFVTRFPFWKALVLHAAVFSLWHVIWPVRDYAFGEKELGAAIIHAADLMSATAILGFVWGYMSLKTRSLWASWAAHFVNNLFVAVLFIRTGDGLISAERFPVFGAVFLIGMLALLLWTRWLSRRLRAEGLGVRD
ncbi:MAG: CPBP family intramembrane metalloprotease [Chloroflexi bacterium]|nr:CPBP family intramembrane metalloprotease [Chloroflexota bacterium]